MECKNYDTVAVEAVVPSSTIMKIVISAGDVRTLDPPVSSPLTPAEFFGAHFWGGLLEEEKMRKKIPDKFSPF